MQDIKGHLISLTATNITGQEGGLTRRLGLEGEAMAIRYCTL